MPRVRWSSRTRADVLRITGYWLDRDTENVPAVIAAIRRRVAWIADGHHLSGAPVAGTSRNYRWYLERDYGYKIYYRLEGDPPETLAVLTLRHGRERPRSIPWPCRATRNNEKGRYVPVILSRSEGSPRCATTIRFRRSGSTLRKHAK